MGIEELPIERREMEAMLQLINIGKVAVSDKTRLPGAATTRAVAELLLGSDYYAAVSRSRGTNIRLRFWIEDK